MKISSISLLLLLSACTCPFQHSSSQHTVERHIIEKHINPSSAPLVTNIPVAHPSVVTNIPSVQNLPTAVK